MRRMFPPFVSGNAAGGLLLLRLVAGAAFMLHGWYKINSEHGAFGWMPADAGVFPVMQAAAAYAEFLGGISWMIGLLTPVACLGIICTMVTALTTVHLQLGHPFVDPNPGHPSYELPLTYLVIGLTLLLVGPGTFSIDAILFGRPPRPAPEPPGPVPPAS